MTEEDIIHYLLSFGIVAEPFKRCYGAQGFGNSIYIMDPEGNTVELCPKKGKLRNKYY